MRQEDLFKLVVELEQRSDAVDIEWQGIKLWPLIRHCLWAELLRAEAPVKRTGMSQRLSRYASQAWRFLSGFCNFLVSPRSAADTLFLSRPVYLQELPDGQLFDRIVDPLLAPLPEGRAYEKLYVSPWPGGRRLFYRARCLLARRSTRARITAEDHIKLSGLAAAAGVDVGVFLARYRSEFSVFCRWFETGQQLFANRLNLKSIYLTSWYIPDMMGLCAAARQRGISVTDVQHGKQGRYQVMYSGWQAIPSGPGYLMMPDRFWCWGEPSCRHILASAPERSVHRPFVGGFPWLDFYRQHIMSRDIVRPGPGQRLVVVTLQPRHRGNPDPIPDFLLTYLRTVPENIHFVFRCHPNDKQGVTYCQERLAGIPAMLISVDAGDVNLYDRLLAATHHITAYSSCCYEASAFGVPTLLFGMDARAIYAEEIEAGEFSWTEGVAGELAAWLDGSVAQHSGATRIYIESSLAQARERLAEK